MLTENKESARSSRAISDVVDAVRTHTLVTNHAR
jgi:hypothetical protein